MWRCQHMIIIIMIMIIIYLQTHMNISSVWRCHCIICTNLFCTCHLRSWQIYRRKSPRPIPAHWCAKWTRCLITSDKQTADSIFWLHFGASSVRCACLNASQNVFMCHCGSGSGERARISVHLILRECNSRPFKQWYSFLFPQNRCHGATVCCALYAHMRTQVHTAYNGDKRLVA